jgi:cytochrome P450
MPTLTTLFSVLVLAVAPWPLIRFVSIPSIRREYSRLAIAAAAIVCCWYLLIAGVALAAARLLPPVAVVAGCLLIAERWRARAGFRAAKGLPPGSLSLVPRGPWVDEKFYAKQADMHGPVFKMSQFFRPMVCVMGPGEGVDLLEQHADDLASPAVRFSGFIPKGYIRYMRPGDHSCYKPIFRAAFNRKVLKDCSMDFLATVVSGLNRMADASRAEPGGIHPAVFVSDMTFKCMLRLFIGFRSDSPEFVRLSSLYERVQIGKASSKWRSEDREAANAIAAFIESRLEVHPGELPSCFLREMLQGDAVKVPDRTVILNLVYMIRIASSDLSGFLTWAIKLLVDNPQWLDRLRAMTMSTGRESEAELLAALMIKEMLRMERSEFIFRKAAKSIRFRGFTIPQNWIVRVCIRDGHRDARTFPNPEIFDPERFRNRTYDKREYSPLGIGSHACLGGQIINLIATIFLVELSRAFRISVTADGCREYGRSHWQPSSNLRVILQPEISAR